MFHSTNNLGRVLPIYYNCPADLTPPPELLLDLQITLPVALIDFMQDDTAVVVIRSLRVDDTGMVYIRLTLDSDDGSALTLASVSTNQTGIPVKMQCMSGVSAHALLGSIPVPGEYAAESPIQVNPALVHVYDPASAAYPETKLAVTQDGVSVFNEDKLKRDIILRVSNPSLFYSTAETGAVTIDSSALTGAELVTSGVRSTQITPTRRSIKSINNIHPNAVGEISLQFSVIGGLSVATESEHDPSTVTLNCSDKLNARLAPEDLLDKHLKPTDGREYEYYPLDDIYCPGDTVGSGGISDVPGEERNTFEILGGTPSLYRFHYFTNSYHWGAEGVTPGEDSETDRGIRTLVPLYDATAFGSMAE